MRFSSYPAYKPSGVEWLGKVPEGWKVKRLKYLANRIDEKIEADQENQMPYIGLENIASWTGKLLPLDPDFIPDGIASRFKGGETLFGKLRPYLAKACNVDFEGLCSSEILVLRPNHLNRQFLLYCLLSPGFISLVDSSTYGVKMPRAGWDFVGSCTLPVPPDDDQHAIVNFLDRQIAKIDTLMAKRRALVEKLKEKRTALISQTVTRGLPPDAAQDAGLDPHPSLKPSGVEWLGEVPEHWGVKRLKYVSRMKAGEGITVDMFDEDGENPVYGGNGLRGYTSGFTHEGEYVLVGRQGALCGNINYAKGRFWASEHAIVVTPDANIQVYWLGEVLRSMNLNQHSIAAAQPGLAIDDIKSLFVAVPPLPEQHAIADFLDHETAKIDRMISLEEAVIERQQEYRSALITAAVTGKIDVREFSHEHGTGSVRSAEA